MRNVKKIAVLLFSAVGIMVFIFSCIKGNLKVSEVGSLKEEYVLPSQELVDDIILPEGTKWRYTSIDKSEVKFSLPDGYIFLLKNLNNNSYLKSDDGGGYSCTCSSTGGCSVVYEQNHGYGCLQSACKGSCTGKPQLTSDNKPTQMLGVLNSFNDELALSKDVKHRASLSVEGKKAFFELPEVQKIIEKNYAFIYGQDQPKFESIDPNQLPSNYFIANFVLFGQSIGFLLPKGKDLSLFPELEARMVVPTGCTCSGTEGTACKFEKQCILGHCVYTCSGCTTCTMN